MRQRKVVLDKEKPKEITGRAENALDKSSI